MRDLAGFAVIGAFLLVAFGSMALGGVVGAALVSLVPAIRGRRTGWRRWTVVAALAGYGGGIVAALVWLSLGIEATWGNGTSLLPEACWLAAAVCGGLCRGVGVGEPRPLDQAGRTAGGAR